MPRSDPFRPLVAFALLIGALLYLGGILYAGVKSIQTSGEPDLNEFVKYSVVTLGGALGTHFGAALGISRVRGGNGSRGLMGLSATRLAKATGATNPNAGLQVAAAYFYFGALVLALVLWAFDHFSADSAELIRTLGFDLLGVIVGIAFVVLNIPRD